MGAEYSRRNLACASHHRCPDGYHSWGGNMSGWQKRPYCWDAVGHPGPHHAQISKEGNAPMASERMEWPNKTPGGLPSWLIETTIHGLRMLAANGGPDDTDDIIAALNGRT